SAIKPIQGQGTTNMRQHLLVGTAALAISVALSGPLSAADLPVKAAAPAAPAVFDWSGWYVGGHVGGAYLKMFTASSDPRGPRAVTLAGGHLGFNVQSGQWVWGLEGDASATFNSVKSEDGHNAVRVNPASIRARLGIAFDRILVYGTAGYGWLSGRTVDTTGGPAHRSFHAGRAVVGGGAEMALNNNWTLRGEALYFLGNTHPIAEDDMQMKPVWEARVGLTYKFGGWGWGKGPVYA